MPKLSVADQFEKTIAHFMAKRQEYARGLKEIDDLFAKYGITLGGSIAASKPVGRPANTEVPLSKKARRRGRGSFSQTAEELVLSLVKSKGMATSAINKSWKESGRGGSADNTLTKLVKNGKLKKSANPEGRGSLYEAA